MISLVRYFASKNIRLTHKSDLNTSLCLAVKVQFWNHLRSPEQFNPSTLVTVLPYFLEFYNNYYYKNKFVTDGLLSKTLKQNMFNTTDLKSQSYANARLS